MHCGQIERRPSRMFRGSTHGGRQQGPAGNGFRSGLRLGRTTVPTPAVVNRGDNPSAALPAFCNHYRFTLSNRGSANSFSDCDTNVIRGSAAVWTRWGRACRSPPNCNRRGGRQLMRQSTSRSRAKKRFKLICSDFLSAKPMSCQPSVEIGNDASLRLSCLLCIAFALHFGGVGIEIRAQWAMQFAKLVLLKNLLHRCSPSRQASQKTPQDYVGKLYPDRGLDAQNMHSPGIVRNPA